MNSAPIRRIAPPPWLAHPPIRAIYDAIGDGRFVGGAVRDLLLGRKIGDLDLATPSPPDQILARLQQAGIKAIPTGLKHGTVTALAGDESVEITTLRRDVETDGRHAIVAFTDDWAEDAARRDFTMNALYLDGAGDLWDPIGGIEDCRAGRVRFVGVPAERLAEDVLRLLRFYRFVAQLGRFPADPAARAACRAMAPSLHRLAGERVRAELWKLLLAPDPVKVIALMVADEVLGEILPEPADSGRLAGLIGLEPEPCALRRLAALLPPGTAEGVAARLRLSAVERERLLDLNGRVAAPGLDADERQQRRALYRLGAERWRDLVLLAGARAVESTAIQGLLTLAEIWQAPILPVTGADTLSLGAAQGPRIGAVLAEVEAWWIEGDFRAGRAECLARLEAMVRR